MDKIEAVLTLLFLEQHGLIGDIHNKFASTPQDEYFVEKVGTSRATDVWAAHFKSKADCLQSRTISLAMKLLEVAFVDVRGDLPEWWNKEILPYKK